MRTMKRKWIQWPLIAVLAVLLGSASQGVSAQMPPMDMGGPNVGIVCTEGVSPNPTFTLTTNTGYISLPDANVLYMWGFSLADGPFQYPGPILCVNEGDTVTVILHNTLPEDVSIIFPGQENVLANGLPAQPQFDGGGALTSLTNVAPANGGSVTYSFVAAEPGTYLYESGTEPQKQIPMGLFGALIVRPAGHPDWAYNRADTQFNPDAEFIAILSEVDPYLSQATELGFPFDMNNYHPRYWLLNGRGLPDTLADNFASWLPAQPYGGMPLIHPYDPNPFLPDGVTPNPAYNPYPALTRYLNAGTTEFPFHPHGKNGRLIARDGRLLEGPAGQDLAYEKFSFVIGPGQTWDETFLWRDVENYDPVTNPVPVTIPNVQDMTYGMLYSGSPYLGEMGPMPPGMQGQNMCGEYYIISHNHALHQLTSWGVVMTGPGTFLRVDPPLPNMCP